MLTDEEFKSIGWRARSECLCQPEEKDAKAFNQLIMDRLALLSEVERLRRPTDIESVPPVREVVMPDLLERVFAIEDGQRGITSTIANILQVLGESYGIYIRAKD